MYVGFVIVHNEPFTVPRELYKEIVQKKKAGEFGNAIGFMIEIDLERASLNVDRSEVIHVNTMKEFSQVVNASGGSSGRSILIE